MDNERYEPSCDFLKSVVAEEVTFGEHAFGQANLARLIALTRDEDDANRDWATMLLVQTGEDSAEIRQALQDRLADPYRDARHEALLGLALRDRAAALPFVAAELQEEMVYSLVLEAAAVVADRSLSPVLDGIADGWRSESPDDWVVQELDRARRACATEQPDHWLLDSG